MRIAFLCSMIALLAACGGQNPGNPDGSTGGAGGSNVGGGSAAGGGSATGGGTGAGGGTAMGGGSATGGGGSTRDGGWVIADHPPLPTLTNVTMGPVLHTPTVHYVFYGSYPYEAQLETFAQHMTDAGYWYTTTHEYGVGGLGYAGMHEIDAGLAPATLSQAALNAQVTMLLDSGTLGPVDPQGIYTFVFPATTTLTMPNVVLPILTIASCTAFGGYHDNAPIHLDDGGVQQIAYAAIPTCMGATVDGLTAVISHEWVEAATDPVLAGVNGVFTFQGGPQASYFMVDADHTIWAVNGGAEAGDLCETEGTSAYITPMDVGNQVQRTWSNLSAMAGHDPCVPTLPGPYFNSAPVLTDDVQVMTLSLGTINTKGIKIPAMTSAMVDVKLFSDATTNNMRWTVQADDVFQQLGLGQTLTFAWDKTDGMNGDTLHLTITVTQSTVFTFGGGHAFVITSTFGSRKTQWIGAVVE
jgi:hypothetical protein